MSSDYKILPLKGKDNYTTWLIDIRAILQSKNGWQYTLSDGSTEITAAAASQLLQQQQAYAAATTLPVPDQVAIERRVRRNWQTNSEKAADSITLTIHANFKAKLTDKDFNDAFKMMSHLKQLYKPSTEAEFFMLMRDLMATRYDIFPSMETYLTHI
ncbi:hypothetical protein EJ02DRAFT_485434 [Clathrospora elynae]|uniref:DUF4219 domain-containing protein n=1 Tax=Clathrospora elynae TaxID=706981 RepID=A0A6A5S7B1_9PLEO|nr:hypothetical protein EJ02DRAFT_485434 [Clathrospora elynae]